MNIFLKINFKSIISKNIEIKLWYFFKENLIIKYSWIGDIIIN